MRIAFVVLGLAVLIVSAAAFLRRAADSPIVMLSHPREVASERLQPLWVLPEFSLTERSGEAITLADLKGKVWVADFFYTTCPGPCPMLTSRLSTLQQRLGGETDVRLVSISTDPEKDTPEVLKLYAQKFGASERWLFLTGEKAKIFDLANKGFKLTVVADPVDAGSPEPITHSTKLALVDREGIMRGFYEGTNESSVEQLLRDIRTLLAK